METQKVDGHESDRHDHADDTSKNKESPDIIKLSDNVAEISLKNKPDVQADKNIQQNQYMDACWLTGC